MRVRAWIHDKGILLFCFVIAFFQLPFYLNAQPQKSIGRPSDRYGFMAVRVNQPGELSQRIPERMVAGVTVLKVKGKLNGDDIRFLNRLANRKELKDTLGKWLEPFFELDLTEATIRSGRTTGGEYSVIPQGFMDGCKLLHRIKLPANTEIIEKYAFRNCDSIREIRIPMGVRQIGSNAFSGDEGLVGVSLPRTLIKIGNGCFEDCTSTGTSDRVTTMRLRLS